MCQALSHVDLPLQSPQDVGAHEVERGELTEERHHRPDRERPVTDSLCVGRLDLEAMYGENAGDGTEQSRAVRRRHDDARRGHSSLEDDLHSVAGQQVRVAFGDHRRRRGHGASKTGPCAGHEVIDQ